MICKAQRDGNGVSENRHTKWAHFGHRMLGVHHTKPKQIYIDGLVQGRRNSIANALELRLSFTKPLIWYWHLFYILFYILIWPRNHTLSTMKWYSWKYVVFFPILDPHVSAWQTDCPYTPQTLPEHLWGGQHQSVNQPPSQVNTACQHYQPYIICCVILYHLISSP